MQLLTMLTVKSKYTYFAKKKALMLALRHFTDKRFENIVSIECICGIDEPFKVMFSKEALIKSLGYDFTKDFSSVVQETLPEDKKKGRRQGQLYHKKDILSIYNKSIL